MTLQDLITGLKNKTVSLLGNHYTNSIIKDLENKQKRNTDYLLDYEEILKKTSYFNFIKKFCWNFWIASEKNKMNLTIGKVINFSNIYCFDCGDNMYIVPISETEIGCIPVNKYWDIMEIHNDKYLFTKNDITECPCCKQNEAKMLVSEIDVPTGELVIANFFTNDELFYEDATQHFKEPSINCLLGRDNLMQKLATKNVGYGQMGNMGISVFSNETDEILITDYAFQYLQDYEQCDRKEFLDEYGDEQIIDKWKDLIQYIETGKFKYVGEIDLSVWRWQCADKKVLDDYKENLETLHCDNVTTKINKGRYRIEHYFGFSNSCLYSKIKLI